MGIRIGSEKCLFKMMQFSLAQHVVRAAHALLVRYVHQCTSIMGDVWLTKHRQWNVYKYNVRARAELRDDFTACGSAREATILITVVWYSYKQNGTRERIVGLWQAFLVYYFYIVRPSTLNNCQNFLVIVYFKAFVIAWINEFYSNPHYLSVLGI